MAAPMVRLLDTGVMFVPGELSWPFPEMLVTGDVEGRVWFAKPDDLGLTWPAGAALYRKRNESQLGPEVDDMENAFRGAEYERLSDLEMYEWRVPEIRWREPIEVIVESGPRCDVLGDASRGFFCRVCIAREGLSASEVEARKMSLGDAIAHLEREHGALLTTGEGSEG